MMSRLTKCLAVLLILVAPCSAQNLSDPESSSARFETYCNPINLSYRFRLEGPSRREAADPDLIAFAGEYWLFTSKSGGYFHSKDLLHWTLVPVDSYPFEEWAPSALVMDGKVYLTSGNDSKLFVADDLWKGKWHQVADFGRGFGDGDLFLDTDGRLYMYYGVSPVSGIQVSELDRKNGFKPSPSIAVPETRDTAHRGWEVRGNDNDQYQQKTYIEASYMTKVAGKYYLQYSAPGTQFSSYGDGVVVADKPTGPFRYQSYSPFSYKPTGFITGAGHSATFLGLDHQLWHVSTMVISVRDATERRLGLFPTRVTPEGELVADTYLGDYPHYVNGDRGLVGWMLLSRKKPVTASSEDATFPARNAVDENIKTWWSAKSRAKGEWLMVDLQKVGTVEAIQTNFADQGSQAHGRSGEPYLYRIETSLDGTHWTTVVDRTTDGEDSPHDYQVLKSGVAARFVRIVNISSPNGAKFSLSGFRVFGNVKGALPETVKHVEAIRNPTDDRMAKIQWESASGAEFYVVRVTAKGSSAGMSYQVYDGATNLTIRSLNAGVDYRVSVDSIDAVGIQRSAQDVALSSVH